MMTSSACRRATVLLLLGIKMQISDHFDSRPFVNPDTGEARSRNDFTFITGLNVSF